METKESTSFRKTITDFQKKKKKIDENSDLSLSYNNRRL